MGLDGRTVCGGHRTAGELLGAAEMGIACQALQLAEGSSIQIVGDQNGRTCG